MSISLQQKQQEHILNVADPAKEKKIRCKSLEYNDKHEPEKKYKHGHIQTRTKSFTRDTTNNFNIDFILSFRK